MVGLSIAARMRRSCVRVLAIARWLGPKPLVIRGLAARSERHLRRDGGGRIALLRTLLDPYRGRVMAATTATVLGTLAKLVPPYLAGLVVDDVVQTGSTRTLVLIAIALFVTLTVAWLAETAETWLVGDIGQRALMDLRFQLVEHLQALPMSYYDRASAGRVMSGSPTTLRR